MFRVIFCLILFLLNHHLVFSQEVVFGDAAEEKFKGAKKLAYKKDLKNPIYIELKSEVNYNENAFFEHLKKAFSMSEKTSFHLESTSKDILGNVNKKYKQYVNGVPIIMARVTLHTKNNIVKAFSGKFYSNPPDKLEDIIEKEKCLKFALNHFGARQYKWQIEEEENFIKWETGDSLASFYPTGNLGYFGRNASYQENAMLLCWSFNIYAQEPLARKRYYVNATNGEIVFTEDLIHHADANGLAQTAYSGQKQITTDSFLNVFRLRESGRGNGIETYDLNNSTRYSNAVDFIDSNNVWDAFSPSLDRYATDAHWGTEMTYDYFQQIHNQNSIDNQGFPLKSYIHYGNNYVNAFWDGQRMTYGDGDATTSPLTTLDITGHEIAHGLTNFSSQLIYASESGALNESFSDIFGVAVEQFARNSNWNWLMGEQIGSPFRSMSNPKAFGDPDTYDGVNWISQNCFPTSTNDWCGVHTNSGVQNYWFYLLAEGGSGVNDKGQTYTVDSLGIIKAAKIAFRNNTVYLNASSDYIEARFYSIISTADLYGACSAEVEAVTNAWFAVGVGKEYTAGVNADFVAENEVDFCSSPAQVQFKSNGSNVLTYYWDFGDGTFSNQANPNHVYSNVGTYSVQLVADGGSCGNDTVTKTNYINVNPSNLCSYSLAKGTTIINDCNGIIYDEGGLNGEYNFSSSDTLIVNAPSSDMITLYLEFISIESGLSEFCIYDYVEIFDGPSTDYPSIGRFCDTLKPSILGTTSNSFTLVFHSDAKKNQEGFKIRWNCSTHTSIPQPNFYVEADTSCNGEIKFVNSTPVGYTQSYWEFGDGKTSSERNPTHLYEQNGDYTVKLKIINSVGQDSITKQNVVHISRPIKPLVIGDSTCRNGDATLSASASFEINWFDDSSANRPVSTGDTLELFNLQNSSTYYVSAKEKVSSHVVVPFSISGNGFYTDTAESIYFRVDNPMILESVVLKTNKVGSKTIVLRNMQGRVLASKEVSISGSGLQASLNFKVYPGFYQLSISSREAGLFVNSTGANVSAYKVPGLFEITGTSLGASNQAYPFFYYLTVKPIACESLKEKVTAVVDTNCLVTSFNELHKLAANVSVYPNPFADELFISGNIESINSISVISFDSKRIEKKLNIRISDKKLGLKLSNLKAGVYILELRGRNQLIRKKIVKVKP